jgi:hypothetical protein
MSRKIRSDKKVRVNPPLEQETHELLCRLALACGLTKTALAEQIISIALNTEDFVHHLQHINDAGKFRIVTMKHNGRITYMDAHNTGS